MVETLNFRQISRISPLFPPLLIVFFRYYFVKVFICDAIFQLSLLQFLIFRTVCILFVIFALISPKFSPIVMLCFSYFCFGFSVCNAIISCICFSSPICILFSGNFALILPLKIPLIRNSRPRLDWKLRFAD